MRYWAFAAKKHSTKKLKKKVIDSDLKRMQGFHIFAQVTQTYENAPEHHKINRYFCAITMGIHLSLWAVK